MYVENSLELADPYWVNLNREVVASQVGSTVSNEDEIIGNDNGDLILHVTEV
jgi:hypothetical protein